MPAKHYSPPALEFKTEDQKDTTQKVVNGVLVVGGVLLAGAAAIFAWQFFLETQKKSGKRVDSDKEVPAKNVQGAARTAADKAEKATDKAKSAADDRT